MSRNSSGTYSLPAGNPVVTGTTITSTWGNTTMSDIAAALTDSLSRTGLGGMQAGLPLFDGTAALPGLAWGTELTSGFYRAGAGDFRFVTATTELLALSQNVFQVSGSAPEIRMNESDASANNKLWSFQISAEDLRFRVLTDAFAATNWLTVSRTAGTIDTIALISSRLNVNNWIILGEDAFTPVVATGDGIFAISSDQPNILLSETNGPSNEKIWRFVFDGGDFLATAVNDAQNASTTWLTVSRTGTTIDSINFATTSLQYGGVEVGLKSLPGASQSGNYTIVAGDNGEMVEYTGTGGHTFTMDLTLSDGFIVTIANSGSGTLTVTASTPASLFWYNGSGAFPSGARTLALAGLITIWKRTGSSQAYVWGAGLT